MSEPHGEMSEPQFFYFEELTSTNKKMKELAEKKPLPDMSVVITQRQTAGRGQMGNSWESEPGMNLTFSLALNPFFLQAQQQFLISQAVAVGIAESLTAIGIESVKVKWPNDIYWGDKKIAGILIENSIMGNNLERCIIGIGLNVNQLHFTSDAPNPVSLAQITNKTHDLNQVLESILDGIFHWYNQLWQGEFTNLQLRYLELMYRNDGNFHPFNDANGPFMGKITGIDTYGRLKITKSDNTQAVYEFKEVGYGKMS